MVLKSLVRIWRSAWRNARRGSFEQTFFQVAQFNVTEAVVRTLRQGKSIRHLGVNCWPWRVTESKQQDMVGGYRFTVRADTTFFEDVNYPGNVANFQPRRLEMVWTITLDRWGSGGSGESLLTRERRFWESVATVQSQKKAEIPCRLVCNWRSAGGHPASPFTLPVVRYWENEVVNAVLAGGALTSPAVEPPHVFSFAPASRRARNKWQSGAREFRIVASPFMSGADVCSALLTYAAMSAPARSQALQSYWWSVVENPTVTASGDRRIHLVLSQDCPSYDEGIRAAMTMEVPDSPSPDTAGRLDEGLGVRLIGFTEGGKSASAIVAAAAQDLTAMLETGCQAPDSGSVLELIPWRHSTSWFFKSIKAYLGWLKTNPAHLPDVLGGLPWWIAHQGLCYLGELRVYHEYGIRLIFRVQDEDEDPLGGTLIRVAAEWATFLPVTYPDLNAAILHTVNQAHSWLRREGRTDRRRTAQGSEWWQEGHDPWEYLNEPQHSRSSGTAVTRRREWPAPHDYSEAIQNPHLSLGDLELRRARLKVTHLGLPRVVSGAFACVYTLSAGGKTWAVRCFLHPVHDQEFRYSEISRFILTDDLPYTVPFEYQSAGIRVGGLEYPIVKMEWVEGMPLHSFIEAHLFDPAALQDLRAAFRKMHHDLIAAGVAHGDLQHGNILVNSNGLFLVDYDNMFVSDLAGLSSNELGHANYQHPRRNASHFGLYLDNFSAHVIDVCLGCLLVDPSLWQSLSAGDDCLLFRQIDFARPRDSRAFGLMLAHRAPAIVEQASHLRSLLLQAPEAISPLD